VFAAVQMYARAVRNCPWSGAVWEAALRALERSGAGDEQHQALAEQALAAGLQVGTALKQHVLSHGP
jgi:hypothetical protein